MNSSINNTDTESWRSPIKPFIPIALALFSIFSWAVAMKIYLKTRHNLEPMHLIIISGGVGNAKSFFYIICFFVYSFFPGLGSLFLLKSLFKFIYIYFPQFEESFQFKFLQWLESSEYLGFNLAFLLQQVDRFLAVYMHLTYYEVNMYIDFIIGTVQNKSEKCQIHVV